MSQETLLSAARRVVRDFNIVMQHGGLMSVEMEQSINTLDKMVWRATAEEKAAAKKAALSDPPTTKVTTP